MDDVRPASGPPLGVFAAFVLLLAPAVDELCSAGPTVGAPDLRSDLDLSVTGLFAFGTLIPVIASIVLEPAVLWLADGPWRRTILLASAAAWSLGYLTCAAAPGPWVLAAGLSATFIAGGIALGVARASLVAASPDVEQALARWTLAASVGDLAGPLALAGIAWLGGGWRAGMVGCGLSVGLWGLAVLRAPVGHAEEDEDGEGASLWDALQDRVLLAWLSAVALCTLLDEIFVAGIALYGTEVLGTSLAGAGLLVACEMAGGVLGLAVFERVGAPARALVPACGLALAGLVGFVLAPDPVVAGLCLFVCGMGEGLCYPLTLAAAHRARPGHPGQVEALSEAFLPVELVFPIGFGLLADRFGLGVALLGLGLQPVGIALVALAARRRRVE
ncbi:MAG: MFS transporter [Myxococcota bacterium]